MKIEPKEVFKVDMTADEVEIDVPHGYAWIQPLDENGNDFDEGFMTSIDTANKVYMRLNYTNGNPRFTIKKKQ